MRENDTGHERRRFRRFPVNGTVRLYSGTSMWTTDLIDLSLRGVLVVEPEQWQGVPGARFRVDLRLEGGVHIGMAVAFVGHRNGGLAFSCDKIDIDSFTRLKRLVELNVGNTELIHRELSALGEHDSN
ncbi:MAG: PilZ domain-containing protein [Xanthomonadales bacterium]|nr:PilZ domain-containing protein [Xanthomonadales bacterium]